MSALLTIIHIFICFILIIAVLLQSGKSADLAGAFGGGGSQSAFGPRGAATILSKVTTICAVLFMVTSLGLWMVSDKGAKSVATGEEAPVEVPAATTDVKKEPDQKEAVTTTTPDNKEAETPPKKKEEQKPPEKKEEQKDQGNENK